MTKTVGIVLPAYKPDPTVLETYIESLQDAIADVVHVEIDAPSGDLTEPLARADSYNIASERRGKGQAITDGFETLSTDVLVFADADAATPAASVAGVIDPVRQGNSDLAIGSRRHPEAVIESHQTRLRRRMGDVFSWLARRFLPVSVHDYQCGAKALSASAWEQLQPHVTETGFAWDLEVIAFAGARGMEIQEVPVRWNDDPESTVDPVSTAISLAMSLISIRHRVAVHDGNSLHSIADRLYTQRETRRLISSLGFAR